MTAESHDLLDAVSLFLYVATRKDIELERERLEAKHDCILRAFEVEHPTIRKRRCTRVTWEIL